MRQCTFTKHDAGGVYCIRCHRHVNLDLDPATLVATCQSGGRRTGEDRYYLTEYRPFLHWRFLYLLPEETEKLGKTVQLDPPDSSKIGTYLTELFASWGFVPKEGRCHCKSLAYMLDQASWNLIKNNQDFVVERILESARQAGSNPPKLAIRAAVKLALLKNRGEREQVSL